MEELILLLIYLLDLLLDPLQFLLMLTMVVVVLDTLDLLQLMVKVDAVMVEEEELLQLDGFLQILRGKIERVMVEREEDIFQEQTPLNMVLDLL